MLSHSGTHSALLITFPILVVQQPSPVDPIAVCYICILIDGGIFVSCMTTLIYRSPYSRAAISAAMPARAAGAATTPAADEEELLELLLDDVLVEVEDESESLEVEVAVLVESADADEPVVAALPVLDPEAAVPVAEVVDPVPVVLVTVALATLGPQEASNEDWSATSSEVALDSRLAKYWFSAVPVAVAEASAE